MLDGILQVKDREDGSIAHPLLLPGRHLRLLRREDQRQVGARLQHPHRRRRRARPRRRRSSVEPMGNMPVIKDLIVGHGRGPLEEGPARRAVAPARRRRRPRRGVHRARRGDDRRHPVDGLHPLRRLRLAPASRWRSTPSSSAPPRSPRPTASSATRATASTEERLRTWPRTRTASTTAPTASPASRSAPRTSRR